MRSKILPAAILAGCVLLLGSCLDIDATMTLDDQGAGTVEFTYTVSPAAVELEKANPREQTVWVLKDRKPVPVKVTTGATDGSMTEIVRGDIAPGTALVVDALSLEK